MKRGPNLPASFVNGPFFDAAREVFDRVLADCTRACNLLGCVLQRGLAPDQVDGDISPCWTRRARPRPQCIFQRLMRWTCDLGYPMLCVVKVRRGFP